MKKKVKFKKSLLFIVIILFFSINALNVFSLTFLSPQEKYYETYENVDKLKINIDYINPYNSAWVVINNQRIDLRENNLVEKYYQPNSIRIVNTKEKYEIDEITNYIEYSFSLLMSGRGEAELNLSSLQGTFGIRYLNDWSNEVWQCFDGNQLTNLGEARRNTKYDFLIKVYNDGMYFNNYDVYINGDKKANCLIEDRIRFLDQIKIDVKGTSANLSNQRLKSGTYNIELPSGKHEATLFAFDNNGNEISISRTFYVVIQGCGNLICDGNKNHLNCPSDCIPFQCDDNALIGDTNNDGLVNEIDKTNLINIMEGRIPYPDRDCCVDLTGDKRITQNDLNKIDKIISGEIISERCFIDCDDGTVDQFCSRNRPLYCDYGTLYENCEECGCPENHICMKDNSCFNLEDCKCSDIASHPDNPLGYDNVVDEFDLLYIEKYLGLCETDEAFNPKLDLNYDGCIDRRDIECIKYNLNRVTYCAGTQICRDGTLPNECSTTLPLFCENDQLVYNCDICGCPKYMGCQNDGTCRGINNFEVIIEEKGSNESKRYMEGGIIYVPLYKNSNQEIDFIINPLRDLQNMSFKVSLDKEGIIFDDLHGINQQLSRRINLNENEHEKIIIEFVDNNNPLGIYKGNIDILINGYIFSSIPIEMEIKEKIPEPIVKEKIDYSKFIPYISALILMIIILIYLLYRRRKERRMIRNLELDNKIILR